MQTANQYDIYDNLKGYRIASQVDKSLDRAFVFPSTHNQTLHIMIEVLTSGLCWLVKIERFVMRRNGEQRRNIEDLNEEEEPNSIEFILFFWVESSSTVNDDHNVNEKCSRRDAYYHYS